MGKEIALLCEGSLDGTGENVGLQFPSKRLRVGEVGHPGVAGEKGQFMVAQEPDDATAGFGSLLLKSAQKTVRLLRFRSAVDHVAHLDEGVGAGRPMIGIVDDAGMSQDFVEGIQFAMHVADGDRSFD